MEKQQESSSETSSYHSDNDQNVLGGKIKMNGNVLEFGSDSDMEDHGPNTYINTKNEMKPEEVVKAGPSFNQTQLDDLDEIAPFGKVVQYIPEGTGVLLVMPHSPESILDLDNIVCLPED